MSVLDDAIYKSVIKYEYELNWGINHMVQHVLFPLVPRSSSSEIIRYLPK